MAAAIEFKDKRAKKFLKDLHTRTKDIDGAKKKYVGVLGIEIFRDITEHFENEEGPEGKWTARKGWYKDWIEAKGFTKILQVSGTLKGGLRPIEAGRSWKKASEGIMWFNPVPYAKTHDEGDPSNKIAKRSFMWISGKALQKIEAITLDYILR